MSDEHALVVTSTSWPGHRRAEIWRPASTCSGGGLSGRFLRRCRCVWRHAVGRWVKRKTWGCYLTRSLQAVESRVTRGRARCPPGPGSARRTTRTICRRGVPHQRDRRICRRLSRSGGHPPGARRRASPGRQSSAPCRTGREPRRIWHSDVSREERGRPRLAQLSLRRGPGAACSPGALAGVVART